MSTVLCLLAAIIMMAMPVMSCCVTGHMDSLAVSAEHAATSAPPCHMIEKSSSSDNERRTPEKYCSSCDDCALLPAVKADVDLFANAHSGANFVALSNTPQALPRAEMRLLRITGPPLRQDLQPKNSPLARFDALLI